MPLLVVEEHAARGTDEVEKRGDAGEAVDFRRVVRFAQQLVEVFVVAAFERAELLEIQLPQPVQHLRGVEIIAEFPAHMRPVHAEHESHPAAQLLHGVPKRGDERRVLLVRERARSFDQVFLEGGAQHGNDAHRAAEDMLQEYDRELDGVLLPVGDVTAGEGAAAFRVQHLDELAVGFHPAQRREEVLAGEDEQVLV